ncbi:MAG: hypothetical protein JXJ04_08200, partial [Spirochaetales bacterium]|nr:hypothetical protein [Spirochaetales bacterium]
MKLSNNYRARILISLLFIICQSITPLFTYSDHYSMDVTLGFSQVLTWGHFFPVTIKIKNEKEPGTGKLVLETIKGSSYGDNLTHTHYSQNIILGMGITEEYSFVIENWNFAFPLTVKLFINDDLVLQKEVDVLPFVTSSRIILCLSSRPIRIFPDHSPMDGQTIQVVYPAAASLPSSLQGYDMVDMIVAYDEPVKPLSDDQMTALREWISRGGTIVLSNKLLTGPFKELITVKTNGFIRRTRLPSLTNTYKEDLPQGSGFPLLMITSFEGDIVFKDDSIPLVIRKSYNQGSVYLCSFDFGIFPFSEWKGRFSFWRDILGPAKDNTDPENIYTERNFEEESFHAYASHLPDSLNINFTFFYILISLYAGIVLFIIFLPNNVLSKVNNALKWQSIAVIACLFIIGGWLVSSPLLIPHNFYYTDIAVISHSNNIMYGDIDYSIGLFSFKNKTYDITYPGDISNVRLLLPTNDKRTAKTIEIEAQKTIKGINPGKWGSIQIDTRGTIKFPVTTSIVRHSSDYSPEYSIDLENKTEFTIQDALLVLKNVLYPIGTIPPGIVIQRKYSLPDSIRTSETIETFSPVKKAAFQTYLEPLRSRMNETDAYITGWIAKLPDPPLFVQKGTCADEICLVRIKV